MRAHLAATGRDVPAVNLKLLVEGEEEQSSPHLAGLVERFRPRLDADLVVLSDTLLWRADAPAVCLGIRGVLSAELEVYGPERDAHSGAVSGPAPSAVLALCRLVAALVGPDGRIALPRFYDDVLPPDESERAAIAALPYSDEDWLARSETRSVGGEEGYSVLERLWLRPALEVTSVVAGDVEGPLRAVTPAVARAAMSIRTVPGQRVERVAEALRTFVADTLGPSVPHALQIALETAQEAYRTPDDVPAVAALRQAIAEGFGREVGQMRNGGGAPADLLASSLGAPVVFFGTGLVEDHWHDSDESVRVDLLHAGTATLALLSSRLAEG
ncbi:M20/M25/M40 family metallo-hydrolase [Cellulomonas marina]|uniref:Peptidase family M20/M25/M40 n=1 Tax=Cellulomonas marina TaxID=988821 RepID=A0A1I0ZVM6_9CELL|nr:hypothetical protein Cma02nite_19970 [Cellulomonas marina]SFB29824.1 Peptidase family M20/M25/M40 [Cellulomonas marina]